MDEIGDEFNYKPGNDKTVEELSELKNESDELNEIDDDVHPNLMNLEGVREVFPIYHFHFMT